MDTEVKAETALACSGEVGDKLEQWRRLIETHAKSEMSVLQFCREYSLNKTQFYYWRARVKHSQRLEGMSESETPRRASIKQRPFIPLVVGEKSGRCALRLSIPSGIVAEFGELPEVGWVSRWIKEIVRGIGC
jgi:hypothetical protein